MKLTRRQTLKAGALGIALPAVGIALAAEPTQGLPESFDQLRPLGERARPLTTEEFQQHVGQAALCGGISGAGQLALLLHGDSLERRGAAVFAGNSGEGRAAACLPGV